MSEYYPPQQYQPKKSHTFRNVVLGVLVGGLLLMGGCFALVGVGLNEATKDLPTTDTEATTKPGKPVDRGAPRAVTVGKAFTIGKHRLDAGWKVTYQQYIGTQVVGTVTNVSTETSTAFFHIKFLKGGKVVANIQCSTSDLEPGQSEDVECMDMVAGSKKVTYDRVTAEATF